MGDALKDWLSHGVGGLPERTVTLYRGTIVKAPNEELGNIRLTELTASNKGRCWRRGCRCQISLRTHQPGATKYSGCSPPRCCVSGARWEAGQAEGDSYRHHPRPFGKPKNVWPNGRAAPLLAHSSP